MTLLWDSKNVIRKIQSVKCVVEACPTLYDSLGKTLQGHIAGLCAANFTYTVGIMILQFTKVLRAKDLNYVLIGHDAMKWLEMQW